MEEKYENICGICGFNHFCRRRFLALEIDCLPVWRLDLPMKSEDIPRTAS